MPTYGYRCTNPDCLQEQDFFHGINEMGSPRCPDCGYPMKRLLSSVPHKFKQKRGTMGVTTHTSRGITKEDIS